jgi:hypothetical protein
MLITNLGHLKLVLSEKIEYEFIEPIMPWFCAIYGTVPVPARIPVLYKISGYPEPELK